MTDQDLEYVLDGDVVLTRKLVDEYKRLQAELESAKADAALTRCQLKASRDDEMQAMAYLSQIRDVIGGVDYPHTVKIAHELKRLVDEMEAQEPITAVQNDYNADGKSNRIYDYLPAGTQLYAAPKPPSVPDACTWSLSDEFEGADTYKTSCGTLWSFIDGEPGENGMKFCHSCGHPVAAAPKPGDAT